MKKLYTFVLMLFTATAFAQTDSVDVTFYVGAGATTVDAAGFHIAGGALFGNPGTNPMTQVGPNNVWKTTIKVEKGASSHYTITNGACPDWSCKENIAGQSCADPGNYNDRAKMTFNGDTVITTIFGICTTDTVQSGPVPPLGAAPTPSIADSTVICLFSDAYTDVGVDTWRTSWSAASLTETKIAGDSMKHYSNLDFAGIETTGANLIDASKMKYFHMDMYSSNSTEFRIVLVDFGSDEAFGGGDDTQHTLFFDTPAQNEWVSLHLNLDSFVGLTNRDNIAQIIIGSKPVGTSDVYIDNVLFTTEESVIAMPKIAAPDPTADAVDVISLFSNVYTDVTVDTWLTSWSAAKLEEIQVEGNDVKRYYDLDFAGIEATGANSIDASGMTDISFDAWTTNATTYRIKVVDFGADNAFGGGDDSDHEIVFDIPAQKTWTTHNIALSDMTNLKSTEHISQIIFSALPTAKTTLFVDNIYFSKPAASGSVKKNALSAFKVYPNPASSYLTVKPNTTERIETISIVDLAGKTLIQDAIHATVIEHTLDTKDLNPGVYFIQVQSETSQYSQKFLVN